MSMYITFKQQHNIKLLQAYPKILQISTAYHQSFVILALSLKGQQQLVIHIDKNGKELFAYASQSTLNKMIMIDDRLVIIVQKQFNLIKRIDLQAKIIQTIPHEFTSNIAASFQPYYFSQTSLLAIVECNNFKEHYIIISYFNTKDFTPVFQDRFSLDSQQNKSLFISKSNERSMIVWTNHVHADKLSLSIHELRQNMTGNVRAIQVFLPQLSITAKNNFLSILKIRQNKRQFLSIYSNPIADIDANNDQIMTNHEIIISLSTLEVQHQNILFQNGNYQQMIIDVYFMGKASIFYTLQFFESATQNKAIKYYFDDQRKRCFGEQPWQYSNRTHIQFNNMEQELIQWKYEGKMNNLLLMDCIKITPLKQIILHWLLHINEQFDDDLLYDVIDLYDIQ